MLSKEIKTSELNGIALDWAVAKCEGFIEDTDAPWERGYEPFSFSTDWAQGGPIIEREGITVSKEDGGWSAYFRDSLFEDDGSEHWQIGPTALIAAMRCYVASKLGDIVSVPVELLEVN